MDAAAQHTAFCGLYIKNVDINEQENYFVADLYWWIKYKITNDSLLNIALGEIEFTNAESLEDDICEVKFVDSIRYITGRYKGKFYFSSDYKDYPLDKQTLSINIESVKLNKESVELIPDTASYFLPSHTDSIVGYNEENYIHGYKVKSAKFSNSTMNYHTTFGDPAMNNSLVYSRINYSIVLERKWISFALKILIPNILLLLTAYLVFFIPAKQLEVAVGCTVTSLLASIALQLTNTYALPEIGYLTKADKLYHLFYALITTALVQTVLSYKLEQNNKIVAAHRLEILGRVFFPIIAIIGILMIIYFA